MNAATPPSRATPSRELGADLQKEIERLLRLSEWHERHGDLRAANQFEFRAYHKTHQLDLLMKEAS